MGSDIYLLVIFLRVFAMLWMTIDLVACLTRFHEPSSAWLESMILSLLVHVLVSRTWSLVFSCLVSDLFLLFLDVWCTSCVTPTPAFG